MTVMGRSKRIAFGGHVYHVLSRANGGLRIFKSGGDFEVLSRSYRKASSVWRCVFAAGAKVSGLQESMHNESRSLQLIPDMGSDPFSYSSVTNTELHSLSEKTMYHLLSFYTL
jgi:hypothetical protein